MNKFLWTLALVPAVALASGCGKTSTNDTVTVTNEIFTPPVVDDNAAAPVPTGQQFADAAAASDAYEVAAGKLAREKATSPALKDFGNMMVTAHTESTAKVQAAAAKAGITPDAEMTDEQEANLKTLQDATGADFDTAYKSQQVTAHQKALAAMQGYSATGDQPDLKAVAAELVPVVQAHLTQIEGM